jgi:ABC-2 type transport system ATP-binding protein
VQLARRPTDDWTKHSSPDSSSDSIVLDTRDLSKVYGRGKQRFEAVKQVSLTLHQGEVLAFLGPNGAGKTTTIKMIAGLVRPTQGRVSVVGEDPHRQPRALRHIGAVLEGNRNLYWRLTPEAGTAGPVWARGQAPYPSAKAFPGDAAKGGDRRRPDPQSPAAAAG